MKRPFFKIDAGRSLRVLAFITAAFVVFPALHADSLRDYPSLDIYRGARAAALAGAYTAIADDSSAISWNTAGLASITSANFGISFNKWIDDSNLEYLSAAIPAWTGVFGAEISYVYLGTFESRDSNGALGTEQIKAYTITGAVGYGMAINSWLRGGLGVKAISQSLDRVSSAAFLIDAGLQCSPVDFFEAGIAMKNFNPGGSAPETDAGIALKGAAENFTATLCGDAKYTDSFGASFSAGLEAGIFKTVYLRTGYDFKKENMEYGMPAGLCAGLGVKLGEMDLDYAYNCRGNLGSTHLITLNFVYSGDAKAMEQVKEKESSSLKVMQNMLEELYYTNGKELYEAGRFDIAIEKWQALKDMDPNYPDIDEKIADAQKQMASAENEKKIDSYFEEGVNYYMNNKYEQALTKFEKVQKLMEKYVAIGDWIAASRKMKGSSKAHSIADTLLLEGIKEYKTCKLEQALEKLSESEKYGLADGRAWAYKKKVVKDLEEVKQKVKDADVYLQKGDLVTWARTLRLAMTACQPNDYIAQKLEEKKALINNESKRLLNDGIEKYTTAKSAEDFRESILSWEKVVDLDPDSANASQAADNIKKAKEKLRSIEKLSK